MLELSSHFFPKHAPWSLPEADP